MLYFFHTASDNFIALCLVMVNEHVYAKKHKYNIMKEFFNDLSRKIKIPKNHSLNISMCEHNLFKALPFQIGNDSYLIYIKFFDIIVKQSHNGAIS